MESLYLNAAAAAAADSAAAAAAAAVPAAPAGSHCFNIFLIWQLCNSSSWPVPEACSAQLQTVAFESSLDHMFYHPSVTGFLLIS